MASSQSLMQTSGNSFWKTCFNTLNALSGAGILSVSYALASGGWLSLIILFVLAATTCYSGILIKRCMDIDLNIKTYPDIGEQAFGSKGRLLASVFIYLELYLVATGFLIVEGDNLHYLFPNVHFKMASGKQAFIVIVALVILPSIYMDNLSLLSYVSLTGIVASVIIFVSLFCVGAFNGVGFHEKGKLVKWNGIPTSLSLYAFCFGAHAVFPTYYASMRKQHQFSKVLIVCFMTCTLSYTSIAIFGYLMFGSQVQSQITLDLPTKKLSSKIAIYTALIIPVTKYALMIMPIVDAIRSCFPTQSHKPYFSSLVSTLLVLSSIVVAISVPFFGSLMSLVGALLNVTVSIILPCVFYLKLSGNYKTFAIEPVVLFGMIVLGVVAVVAGTYTAIVQLATHAKTNL